jgi:hypothetical protein
MCVGLGSGTRYLAEGGRQGVREGGSQALNRAWGKKKKVVKDGKPHNVGRWFFFFFLVCGVLFGRCRR